MMGYKVGSLNYIGLILLHDFFCYEKNPMVRNNAYYTQLIKPRESDGAMLWFSRKGQPMFRVNGHSSEEIYVSPHKEVPCKPPSSRWLADIPKKGYY